MGIFDRLGQSEKQGQQAPQISPEIMQEVGTLKTDPGAYLRQHSFNIPAGMTDPRQITVYLLRTGQVGANRLQQIMFGRGAK